MARAAWTILALMTLAGCASSGTVFGGARDDGADPSSQSASARELSPIDTGGLAAYLQTLRELIEGDSLTQARIFNELEDAAEFAPTKMNRLLYALALSVPGHPGTDPAAGAERLRALVAAGDTLTPQERILARILLQSANRLDVLQTAALGSEQRLAGAIADREAELNAEHTAELERALAENEALRRELESATAMLDAITNIERSISEREEP
ncbi:MAG TPA: hypothetical protein VMR74_08850 [Gammaproteobacteria bacterium]|nr:hypothetical protein [Gammaproteobacteria bacterium]